MSFWSSIFDTNVYSPIIGIVFLIMIVSMICLLSTLVFVRKDGENIKNGKRCTICKKWLKDQDRRYKQIDRLEAKKAKLRLRK